MGMYASSFNFITFTQKLEIVKRISSEENWSVPSKPDARWHENITQCRECAPFDGDSDKTNIS